MHTLRSLRLRMNAVNPVGDLIKRFLTQQETSTALRPFYFAVHPDLFGNYPEEKTTNEESLKILNSYIQTLWVPSNNAKPVSLKFYIRLNNNDRKLKEVNVNLLSLDARTLVRDILKACELPLEYVESIKPKSSPTDEHNIRWHPSFHDFFGKTNPNMGNFRKNVTPTLSSWLRLNLDVADQLSTANHPVLKENTSITDDMIESLRVTDVEWNCNWGPQQFNSCLKSFDRLYQQHKNERFISALRGHVLSFCNATGVCFNGKINLSSDDVPQNWINLLISLPKHMNTLRQLPEMERRVSVLLNGIQIGRRENIVMVDEYSKQLTRLIHTLESDTTGHIEGAVRHVQLVVESAAGPLTVSRSGQILIPFSCPGFLVKNFIQQKKEEAFTMMRDYRYYLAKENDILQKCKDKLELLSLRRDQSLSSVNVIKCCKRLINNPEEIGVSLKGKKLKISQFYSIMQDGEIVIPCNWRGHS
ncbi:T-cell activation inhibitor, mitochondrial-like [Tubulanus polymorphus]|uniref:T-cell activation inhibitor, mitochondrial-like n=1 Tax=Tubulanus polymorphus TaxID=672921 RepID=UPI003DA51DB1